MTARADAVTGVDLELAERVDRIRLTVEQWLPDPDTRYQCLSLLADLIVAANSQSSVNWVTTFRPDRKLIRLNIGWVLVCTISAEAAYFHFDAEAISAEALGRIQSVAARVVDSDFRAITGVSWAQVDPAGPPDVVPLLREHAVRLVERAQATGRHRSPWWRSHKPEVIRYLERVVDRELPQPAYFGETIASDDASDGVPAPEEVRAALESFRQVPLERLRIRLRQRRAEQLREQFTRSEHLDLETFNREVWVFESMTSLRDRDIKGTIFARQPLSSEQIAELEAGLESEDLAVHGNSVWGTGSSVYGARLTDEGQKLENVRQAVAILKDGELAPVEKAKRPGDLVVANRGISEVLGIGEVIAPGYEWRPERAEYRHAVRVRWNTTVAGEIPPQRHWATTTVAEVPEELYRLIASRGVSDRPRAWIFQADPKRYDVRGAVSHREELSWRVRQHATEIHAGDTVYLWEAGPEGGVVAVAHVLTEPGPLPEDEQERPFVRDESALGAAGDQVRLRIVRAVPRPVSRDMLRGHPTLGHLPILRMAQGTNLRLSAEQSEALDAVIAEQLKLVELRVGYSEIVESLASAGLHFAPEVVSSYLLALQTKRFVILTGISGTGKTRLAMAVAESFRPRAPVTAPGDGPVQPSGSDSNYRIVAVRPDWADNRGLLGYFNPLLNRYSTTPALELLLRARDEHRRANREGRLPYPFFLILDEMNLAHVEHYFSDFLSSLESGQAIDLHSEVALEMATSADGSAPVPRELEIPPNVYFTGTVNVDETTYMFSPKVLDRAFTIELNEVDLASYAGSVESAPGEIGSPLELHGFLGLGRASQRQPNRSDWIALMEQAGPEVRDTVLGLHGLLAEEQRHFGFRVANEIARFVMLAYEQTGRASDALWAALDLAILMKVLPKLHGTQQELEEPLTGLFGFAMTGRRTGGRVNGGEAEWQHWRPRGGVLERLAGADEALRDAPRLPRTAAKLWRMLRRLR
ncbi:MAG: EVE domain-containing protein, partial [Chloroflexi bacterium]|nr:EVE domain-containing protein [Chloroflexota bacterium]